MQTLLILVGLVLTYPFHVTAQTPSTPDQYLKLLQEIEDASLPPESYKWSRRARNEHNKNAAPRLELLYRRQLAYQKEHMEPVNPEIVSTLIALANALEEQKKLKDSDDLLSQALQALSQIDDAKYRASRWQKRRPQKEWIAQILQQRGQIAIAQKRITDADKYFAEAHEALEREFGYWHDNVGDNSGLQGELLREAGYPEKSLRHSRRELEIYEKLHGSNKEGVANRLALMADALAKMDRGDEANQLYAKGLSLLENSFPPIHKDLAFYLIRYGINTMISSNQGLQRSELLYRRALQMALALNEQFLVAYAQLMLSYPLSMSGRSGEAEILLHQSIPAITQLYQRIGERSPLVDIHLPNLARLLIKQERYDEAELIVKKLIESSEKAPDGTGIDALVQAYGYMADIEVARGNLVEAERLLSTAIKLEKEKYGGDDPRLAMSYAGIAEVQSSRGHYPEAMHSLTLAHKLQAKSTSLTKHYDALGIDEATAGLFRQQKDYVQAEKLYRSVALSSRKIVGEWHSTYAQSLADLALVLSMQGKEQEALPHIDKAVQIATRWERNAREGLSVSSQAGALSEVHRTQMDILNSISRSQPKVASQYRELAFKAYQRAVDSQAAGAIALFAAKEGAVNPELRKSLQDRQGIFEQWRLANKLLVEESTASGGASENAEINALRKKINEYDAKLLELDELVKKQYPEYFRNIFPEPRSVAGTEDLLSDDEAVLGWVLGTEKSFLWVVLSNRAELIELQTDAKTVAKEVNQIRSAIEQYPDGKFPLEVSSALFDRVFRPALPMLESVKHIYVIPDGALTTLPFHLLVTGPRSVGVATKERSANVPGRIRNLVASPTTAGMDTDENLANVPWLVRRFAITTLPSIGSLHVLKEAKKRPAADIAFLGIGDPVLSAERNSDSRKRSFNTLFMRGKTADVSAIRQAGELPESADELRALAKSLGSGESSLLLRERATETSVKGMDLSRQQVIAFATHGFLAGEIKGVAEPGLILTPPKEASELDDGVLTASEISQLKLNTDWVILSACNTAGSASNGRGQGLSGLARAFFMAGAKSLLVSHWPVVSVAAQRLTTEMFEELRKDKDIRKAEALRRAMLTTMNDSSIPFSSHPAVWAPFVVVGP